MKRETLTESVFRQLQASILRGELAPGSTLPPERTIAEELGINRGAIREALKKLESANLITTRQGGKTRVLNFRESAGLDVIGQLIFSRTGGPDLEVVRSLIELRVTIQPEMARLAVLRGDEDLLPNLRELLREMKLPDCPVEEINRLVESFWGELGRQSGNISFLLILNTLRTIQAATASGRRRILKEAFRDFSHFERIVDAVESGDPDAALLAAKERSDMIGATISKIMAGVSNESWSTESSSSDDSKEGE